MFSRVILIDRGLKKCEYYLVFRERLKKRESGDDDVVDTPVPIPNTEVKHHSGYGIARESGKLPGSFFLGNLPI